MERKVYIITPKSQEHWQEMIEILLSNGFVFNVNRMKSVKEILECPWHWPGHPSLMIGHIATETECKMVIYNCSNISSFGFILTTIDDFIKNVLPTW